MGIPRLTKHLLPFAESVMLQSNRESLNGLPSIESVVIDGPSLVYYIFSRLLAWKDPTLNILDAQPSCCEVSFGVMVFLLQLMCSGINIHQICFDGALPISKRETRISRLEKSRKKLELLRSKAQCSSATFNNLQGNPCYLSPDKMLSSRNMPARYQNALENPATVSAVYEDLKSRWNQKRIFEAVKSTKFDVSVDLDEDYPWANLTTMVPGEADVECARISRSTGCSILTNDSDLLIHDLGTGGSVVFLNAMEMNRYDPSNPQNSAIKSVRLSPSTLARQLGVPNLRRFAFELNRDPHLSQAELIQRSRDPRDAIPDYHTFAEEYQIALDRPAIEKQSLDARVSELFWQYDAQGTYAPDRVPHMYLGILNEDHARKCAWEQGRSYRNLGYSILNTHSPAPGMCTAIYEHIRRGGRIAVDQISLSGGEQLMTEVKSVTERLTTARTVFNDQFSSPTSWRVFAMCEVYGSNTTQVCLPDANQLDRFFRLGYMGKQLGWPDMHTFAEIQAVLYSLRILKQLLNVSDALDSRLLNLRSILASLPPLRVLMRSRYEVTLEFPTYTAHGFESRFYQLSERLFNMRPPEQASQQQASPSRDGSKRNAESSLSGRQPQRRKDQLRSANIFDLLQ